MYHIKEDLRSYKSAELIYQALLACMQREPFHKITVTELQRISSVGRATFYRHFDSVIDVLHWKCDLQYKDVMERYIHLETHPADSNEFLIYFFQYWMEHFEVLDALISLRRYDIIFQCHYSNAVILQNYFSQYYTLPSTGFQYYMSMRIGAFVGILITWFQSGRKETAEELVALLESDLKFSQNQSLLI